MGNNDGRRQTADSTNRHVFCQFELLTRLPYSLDKELKAKVKDQASNHHDRYEANDLGPDQHNTERQGCQLKASKTAVTTRPYKEQRVGVDKVVLHAPDSTGQKIREPVKLELVVQVGMIFANVECQCRHIDRDMEDPKECQCKHGGDTAGNSSPVHLVKLYCTENAVSYPTPSRLQTKETKEKRTGIAYYRACRKTTKARQPEDPRTPIHGCADGSDREGQR